MRASAIALFCATAALAAPGVLRPRCSTTTEAGKAVEAATRPTNAPQAYPERGQGGGDDASVVDVTTTETRRTTVTVKGVEAATKSHPEQPHNGGPSTVEVTSTQTRWRTVTVKHPPPTETPAAGGSYPTAAPAPAKGGESPAPSDDKPAPPSPTPTKPATNESPAPSSPSPSYKETSVPSPSPSSSGGGGGGGKGLAGYKQMVAFGDNLSDNGNGSCAHGVAGDPETVYGFGTWTDGPVAVSYLSDMLGVPLTADYAFGHAAGGSKFGATVDNGFTKSDAEAPDAAAQISNYTSSGAVSKEDTLYFFWFGNNDVLPWLMSPAAHIFFGEGADTGNAKFAAALAGHIADGVGKLITQAGAGKVIVPNVYPRHVAPVVAKYFKLSEDDVAQYGKVIQSVNTQLEKELETRFGDKVIYYDAFGFMMGVYNKALQPGGFEGITHMTPGADICDGASAEAVPGVSNWDLCQKQKKSGTFYWMQFLDPTTHVHKLVAQDMARVVKAKLGA